MTVVSEHKLLLRINELENRLEESEQLIEAIKSGEVDAFAINGTNESEIYTLQSGDYAYRVLIEEFGEGAINVTEDGLIVYSNPYFADLLKLPYEKVIGSSIFNFIHEDSKSEFKDLFASSLSGKSRGEFNLCIKDTVIPVYVSMTSLQPKLATVGIIITDFTEKKKIEKVILEYQKSLERKNFELVQNNEELASFAYIASHDLQEPLRKIQTFATRIMEKELATLSESGRDHFNRMQIAAKRMQNLIKDLLTYSRTNAPERKFVRIDLNNIVAEIKSDLSEELQQKKAVLELGQMCEADIIPFQIRQLFHNLISNSLKFAKPGLAPRININSKITSGVRFKDKNNLSKKRYCHISYADDGIGFDQQYSEKVFELFQRLHVKAEYQGTGIGLAIVKKIVINHNGIIEVKSAINEGAKFDIYLPLHD